jgi:hypothetical protein
MSIWEKQINLYVGTPVHSDVDINYFCSILNLQKEAITASIPIHVQCVKSSLVTQGRQMIVSNFLETNASHLLFIDSDISFEVQTIKRMLAADKDIILTPYPVKDFNSEKVLKKLKEGSTLDLKLIANQYTLGLIDNVLRVDNGIAEIERGPAGCMLIKREVFIKLIEKYPNRIIKQHTLLGGKAVIKENLYNFFDTFFNEKDNSYTGEDFYFCKLCRDAGFKIYALVDEYITHHGSFAYKGRLIDDFDLIKNDTSTDIKKP